MRENRSILILKVREDRGVLDCFKQCKDKQKSLNTNEKTRESLSTEKYDIHTKLL